MPPPTLPTPTTAAGRAGLAAALADPAGVLLATDYDGTLAPIVPDPATAAPEPGAVETLTALADRVGHLAVVSGRPAATAVALGGLDAVPGLVVLGLYGAERWADGVLDLAPRPVGLDAAAARIPALLDLWAPGAGVEDKGASLAVHTRRADDPEGAWAALQEPLERLAQDTGLVVEPGRLVLELRASDADKGRALAGHARAVAARVVVFVGDDLGDLAAFAAVDALRGGGLPGLTVASASPESPTVAAAADLVVAGPAGVVGFLRGLAHALG